MRFLEQTIFVYFTRNEENEPAGGVNLRVSAKEVFLRYFSYIYIHHHLRRHRMLLYTFAENTYNDNDLGRVLSYNHGSRTLFALSLYINYSWCSISE